MADLYKTALDIECFIQNIDDPLNLTVEEIIEILEKSDELFVLPMPAGWDNFYYGSAVLE